MNASSNAWVGCSWQPSPALTTRAELHDATRCGAPARRVAHDDRVDTHRVDRLHGVEQALALLHRRRGDREGHRVGREALGRGLEREPRASGVFVEQRHDGLAAQRGNLRDVALRHFEERVGEVEHRLDPRPSAQIVDRKQVLHDCPRSSRSGTPQRSTPSSPSTSASRTRTSSLERVGRFLPT